MRFTGQGLLEKGLSDFFVLSAAHLLSTFICSPLKRCVEKLLNLKLEKLWDQNVGLLLKFPNSSML